MKVTKRFLKVCALLFLAAAAVSRNRVVANMAVVTVGLVVGLYIGELIDRKRK